MRGAKILIVEDEGVEALDMRYRLKSMGYDPIDTVFTGDDAVGKAEELSPDLVLMDIMLQGSMDGVTAAEQIRTRFDIPVIYVTAYADEDTLQRAKITEPYGYLIKPFQERELSVTIDMALYKHETERRLKENEKWLATTLRSIGDALIATDRDGLVTFVNPVAERLMGWNLEEVLHKELSEVFHIVDKNTRQPAENPAAKALLEGLTLGMDNHTVLIARDGTEIPIDDSAAPIKDDKGNTLGVILVFRDVTEREAAAAELRRAHVELKMNVKQLSDSEASLRIALQEKEILLKELHHRTKNNMQVISSLMNLHTLNIKDGSVKQSFQEMRNRIQAMALVHEKLYQSRDLSNIDMGDYIGDLTKTIYAGLRCLNTRIALNLDLESIPFSIDRAIPCGLIINELMSNAMKYAFRDRSAGRIDIALRSLEGDEIEILFADNGVGLPEYLDLEECPSLGLKIVYNLTKRQLDGDIELERESGLKYRIRFRKKHPINRV